MSLKWSSKDPDEVLDYKLDWLGSESDPGPLYGLEDAISDSVWDVPSGLSKESDTFDDDSTTIWLSGGELGQTYSLLNRITTTGGRVFDQTVKLPMKAH
jgi:hypothetical protein